MISYLHSDGFPYLCRGPSQLRPDLSRGLTDSRSGEMAQSLSRTDVCVQYYTRSESGRLSGSLTVDLNLTGTYVTISGAEKMSDTTRHNAGGGTALLSSFPQHTPGAILGMASQEPEYHSFCQPDALPATHSVWWPGYNMDLWTQKMQGRGDQSC
eukprot:gene12815-biopygen14049